MTVRRHGCRVIASVAAAFFLGVWQIRAAQEPAVAAEDAVRSFVARVEAYARLHQRLEAPLPPLEGADPLSRLVNRRYLAAAIRVARRHAKQGDVLTPDVAEVLRQRLTEGLSATERAALIPSRGGEADMAGAAVVNEPFREEESCAVPARLLERLPPLPEGVLYRILGSGLVLWDVHADIVIDVLPDAFRAPSHVSSR